MFTEMSVASSRDRRKRSRLPPHRRSCSRPGSRRSPRPKPSSSFRFWSLRKSEPESPLTTKSFIPGAGGGAFAAARPVGAVREAHDEIVGDPVDGDAAGDVLEGEVLEVGGAGAGGRAGGGFGGGWLWARSGERR